MIENIPTATQDAPQSTWLPSAEELTEFETLVSTEQLDAVKEKILSYHYSAQADIIQHLRQKEQRILIAQILTKEEQFDFWAELDESVRSELAQDLDVEDVSSALKHLDSDDAVALLEDIDDSEAREAAIERLDAEDQHTLRSSLAWPEDSAGRLMQQDFIALPAYYTVGDTIDWFRQQSEEEDSSIPESFYDIYLLDPMYKPVGQVSLSKLLRSQRNIKLADIINEELPLITADTDQEDVAFRFRQQDLISAPVVDKNGRMLGVITVDDVVDVIEEVHEADFMALGGVQEEDLYERVQTTAKLRIKWLLINMCTAALATFVISLFENTISSIVVLAALMPIVASLGGNAGSQTLTIAVRALATKELGAASAWRFVRKELFVALLNGLTIAVVAGFFTFLWQQNILLSVVISMALMVNLITAGLFGALVPLALERFGIDPAVSSSVLLTAITDIMGFFVFLSFASIILL